MPCLPSITTLLSVGPLFEGIITCHLEQGIVSVPAAQSIESIHQTRSFSIGIDQYLLVFNQLVAFISIFFKYLLWKSSTEHLVGVPAFGQTTLFSLATFTDRLATNGRHRSKNGASRFSQKGVHHDRTLDARNTFNGKNQWRRPAAVQLLRQRPKARKSRCCHADVSVDRSTRTAAKYDRNEIFKWTNRMAKMGGDR
jgi:hypothetical protein